MYYLDFHFTPFLWTLSAGIIEIKVSKVSPRDLQPLLYLHHMYLNHMYMHHMYMHHMYLHNMYMHHMYMHHMLSLIHI